MLSKTEVIEEIWFFSPAHFLLRIQKQDCVNWYWGVSFEVRKKPMILFFLLNIVFDCFISLLPSSPDIIGSPNLISPLNERISRGWEWILGKSIWGNPEMSQYSSLPTAIIVPVDLSSWWSIYLMPSYLVRTPCTEFSDRGFPTLWAGLLPLSLVEARLHADHPAVSSRKSSPSFRAC